MLQLKSKPKEIEYHLQQVEMLAMSDEDNQKLARIIALKELVSDPSIKKLVEEDLKDLRWIEETTILINTCYKRQAKSSVLQEHIKQCKNFMVFRYIEDKLLYAKEVIIQKDSWEFTEIDANGNPSQWVNFKFTKSFDESDLKDVFTQAMKGADTLTINPEWLYKNKDLIYSEDIFEDIDFLLKKKRRTSN